MSPECDEIEFVLLLLCMLRSSFARWVLLLQVSPPGVEYQVGIFRG